MCIENLCSAFKCFIIIVIIIITLVLGLPPLKAEQARGQEEEEINYLIKLNFNLRQNYLIRNCGHGYEVQKYMLHSGTGIIWECIHGIIMKNTKTKQLHHVTTYQIRRV